MLRQHVERARCAAAACPARPRRWRRARRGIPALRSGWRAPARLRRLVHAVIGAADPLHEPRRAFRRADIDDEIDIAPVDAEIERGGADHGAQPAGRHRGFDLAPLRYVERAVMQRDGEIVVVDLPELLEDAFGLAARIDEHQRRAVRRDQPVNFVERVARRVAGPGQPLARIQHGDVGRVRRLRR